MSPLAYQLYSYLERQPPGYDIVMEDLVRELRSSKTAIRAAFRELEEEGVLTYTQES